VLKIIFMNMNIKGGAVSSIKGEDRPSAIFKALASASRRNILELLRDGEQCVCHLEASTGYRQAYLSQQLKVLRETGLIEDRHEGWNVYYRVIDPQIFLLLEDTYKMTGQEENKHDLTKKACPCPKCNPGKGSTC